MTGTSGSDSDYVRVAEIEVDAVTPGREGFLLSGRGADRAEYRLELRLDMPIDERTRAVLAELFSQSEWRILRRARQPAKNGPLGLRKPSGA